MYIVTDGNISIVHRRYTTRWCKGRRTERNTAPSLRIIITLIRTLEHTSRGNRFRPPTVSRYQVESGELECSKGALGVIKMCARAALQGRKRSQISARDPYFFVCQIWILDLVTKFRKRYQSGCIKVNRVTCVRAMVHRYGN